MFSKLTDGKSFMVCGPVSRDAEYKQVGEKKSSLCKFSIKCDETPNSDGTTTAVWTNCECWHSIARAASKIKKVDTVFAIGKIKKEEYTNDQTGEVKTAKKLVVEFLQVVPFSASAQSTASPPPSSYPTQAAPKDVRCNAADDDYPF